MKCLFENHDFKTESAGQFIDMTDSVQEAVERSGVANGLAVLYSPHTTCAVVINERESGFLSDFSEIMESLVPAGRAYRHDDMSIRTENLEDDPHETPNGHAHCRQSLLGSTSQTVPVIDGRLRLGRWQRIFFLELDHARDRKFFIQVIGD